MPGLVAASIAMSRSFLLAALVFATLACGSPRRPGGGIITPNTRTDAGVRDAGQACAPTCAGKECGDDGCGGSCGMCPVAAPFCVDAACVVSCTPDCNGKECGDDGCGGSCGTCPMAAPNCAMNLCTACTPSCGGRQCGDDGCGGSCGMCPGGATCDGAGMCVGDTSCAVGATRCTDSGGFEACGLASVGAAGRTFGARVPCWNGNSCASGACSGQCGRPEVMVLVDRSSSMQGARWNTVIDGFAIAGDSALRRARLAIRMFPLGGGCGVGSVQDIQSAAAFAQALTPPNTDGQTPLAGVLSGVEPWFGDPNQGQAVVLITDGDETCATDAMEAVLRAQILHRAGIRVYVIGVTQAANPTLMTAIAQAGGTATFATINTGPELATALANVLVDLDACEPMVGNGAIGDACMTLEDCAGDACLTSEAGFTWPDGYCTSVCTTVPCPTGAFCVPDPTGSGLSVCLKQCVDDLDCRAGYMCNTVITGLCVPL